MTGTGHGGIVALTSHGFLTRISQGRIFNEVLKLNVLGTLTLQSTGGTVPPEAMQKRRLGLLALLAAGDSRGLSRERIQAFLWPESDSMRSRHAMDQLIYATRRALGVDPFLAEGGDMRLDPSVVATDLRDFRSALESGELARAVAGYGGPLLDGFHMSDSRELESLLDGLRARVAGEYHTALETLAVRAHAAGELAASLSWRRKLAESDPLSSRVAANVVRALILAGDRPSALQYATSYRRRVKEDLGVEPDPEIRSLIASLMIEINTSPLTVSDTDAVMVYVRPAAALDGPTHSTSAVIQEELLPQSPRRWRLALPTAAAAIAVTALIAVVTARERALGTARTQAEQKALEHGRGTSPVAARYYLAGVNLWNDRSKEGLDSAVMLFRRATELDPLYADAFSGLADAYVMLGYSGYRPARAMFSKAREAALRSIALDSTRAAPYAALGMQLTGERQFVQAEAAFRTSLQLAPRYATAHQWYGILLMIVGRKRDAVDELRRAADLDPLSLQIQNNYATFLGAVGDRDAAVRHYEKMVREEPDTAWVRRNPWLLTNMAATYARSGNFDVALRAAERAVEIQRDHPRALSALAGVYLRMGDRERAWKIFARADTANEHYAAYRALMHLSDGNRDSAFTWFAKVKEWGIPVMISLSIQEAEMQRDKRFTTLMRGLGMRPSREKRSSDSAHRRSDIPTDFDELKTQPRGAEKRRIG